MNETDVVVIGSGAGGSPVAYRLAQAGVRVLLLERGPRYTRQQFVHDEVRIARRNFFVPGADTDPHVVVAKGREPERTNEGWISSCVGGGTVHMSGFFYRFHPVDFRMRSQLGNVPGAEVADWPITYEALAPYYDEVEALIGVSGPPTEGPFAPTRAKPYPLPQLATHPLAGWLDKAAQKLGVTAFETPRAIVSRPYQGRAGCVYCQLCGSFGCEVGAKSSTLETLIPMAEATGKCTVLAEARVLRVESDRGGTRVIYTKDGQQEQVQARAVVVACSAIESARLLLLSTSAQHPNGLGNNDGQVGKHLMFSTLSKAHGTYEVGRHDAAIMRDPSPFLGRSVLDYYLPQGEAAVQKGGALNFLFPSGGPIFQSEMVAVESGADAVVFGRALSKKLHSYWHDERQVDCETFGEYLPTPGTHVTLDPEVVDQAGVPAARITIDRHPHDIAVSRYLGHKAITLLEAAGAQNVHTSNLGGRTMHLPMGGLRMGKSAKNSAVDADCKLFGTKNVFVSDGSVFASSGGVPPTMTILANALRVADSIVNSLRRRDF